MCQPEPLVYKVIFVAENGTIIGESEQTPESFEKLIVPQVAMNAGFEFLGWNPEIPEKGKIDKDYVFRTMYERIPTLEEVKAQKKLKLAKFAKVRFILVSM